MSDRESQSSRFSLGVGSSRRLRGGFRASVLPASGRARPSPSTTERSDTQQPRVCDEATDSEESSGGSGSGSLLIICRNIHEQLGNVSRRILVVEQQQKQISLAVKELSSLMKRQEKALFLSKIALWRYKGQVNF